MIPGMVLLPFRMVSVAAFYLMRRRELVDRWKWVGYCYFAAICGLLHNQLVTESGCSGNDGARKLFWGIKNLSSCWFLVAIKFFSHFIGECQCKYAVRFEMKSREDTEEDTELTGCN